VTPHKIKIALCHNVSGKAGTKATASELAPAQPNTHVSASNLNITNTSTLPPGTVVSCLVYLEKNLVYNSSTNSTSNSGKSSTSNSTTNKQAERTTTMSTRNGGVACPTSQVSTSDETTTVEVEPKRFNYENVDSQKLNERAFEFTASGDSRSVAAARKAKSRSTQLIVNAILSSGTKEQQALALKGACLHPKTISLTKSAGLLPIAGAREHKLLIEGVKKTFKEVLGSGKRRRVNADRWTFAEILSSSFAGSQVSKSQIASLFDLNKRSCKRLFKKGEARYENATTMDGK
jgi:hypothetical protein